MASEHSPTVRRRRLALELRRLREAARLTCEEVADHLECSASKISRVETGRVSVSPRDVRDMLGLYGVPAEQRESLVACVQRHHAASDGHLCRPGERGL
jgi:transcriptional regulator with XRE-family HTH domain